MQEFVLKIINAYKRCILPLFLVFFTSSAIAFELQVKDYDGQSYDLKNYRGKWLILNYWATWCPPCLKEIPMLSDYHEANENVKVFGLHYERPISKDKLDNFVDTYLISYPIIPMTRDIIQQLGDAKALPMTVFISPDGKIHKKYVGLLTKKFLDKVIQ